jgi:hypothetical protein
MSTLLRECPKCLRRSENWTREQYCPGGPPVSVPCVHGHIGEHLFDRCACGYTLNNRLTFDNRVEKQ